MQEIKEGIGIVKMLGSVGVVELLLIFLGLVIAGSFVVFRYFKSELKPALDGIHKAIDKLTTIVDLQSKMFDKQIDRQDKLAEIDVKLNKLITKNEMRDEDMKEIKQMLQSGRNDRH